MRNRAKKFLEERGYRVAPLIRNGNAEHEGMDLFDLIGIKRSRIALLVARRGKGITPDERYQIRAMDAPSNAEKIVYVWPELSAGESGIDPRIEFL